MVEAKEKRRKILVTGSCGMLGSALCRVLSEDFDVFGLDSVTCQSKVPSMKSFMQCDICDAEETKKCINKIGTEAVIHAAAWTNVDGCEKNPEKAKAVNIEGTQNVANAISTNTTFLYISTDFVFDGKKKEPYTEHDKPNPINTYGLSKLDGENVVKKLHRYTIIRTSWIYGLNGKSFVDAILKNVKGKKDIKVVDDQAGSPTYSEDLARAIVGFLKVILETKKIEPLFHISNRGVVSRFDYAKEILLNSGIDNVKVIPIKSKELDIPTKRPAFSALDPSLFENLTGITIRNWKDALKEFLNETTKKCTVS